MDHVDPSLFQIEKNIYNAQFCYDENGHSIKCSER